MGKIIMNSSNHTTDKNSQPSKVADPHSGKQNDHSANIPEFSEAKYRLIFESFEDLYYEIDMAENIRVLSPSVYPLTGWLPEELIGQPVRSIYQNPEDRNQLLKALFTVGSVKDFIVELKKKDGAVITSSVNSHVICDAEGNPTGISGTIRDVSELFRTQKALQESEEKFRTLAESSPFAIMIYQNNQWIYTNPAGEKICGYTSEELYQRNFWDFIHPDDLAMVRSRGKARQSGQETKNSYEFRIIAKGGIEKFVMLTGASITYKGQPAGMISVFDITDRKQAEQALIESRRQLADVIDFLPDATLAIDSQKRVIIWNKEIEKMTGVPAAEMIGKGDYAYTVPFYGEARPQLMDLIFEENKEILALYPNIVHEGESLTAEVFCNALYGNKGAWMFVKASPLHDQTGNIIGAIERIRDITERKRAVKEKDVLQAQLLQAQKMESVGRLAGGVAHDFNNMLTAIIGHAELAMMKCPSSASILPHLKAIADSAHRSANLTRQLLAFARKQTVAPKVLDINDTVSGMLKMLRRLISENIELVWIPGSNLWKVNIDPSQIDQILANLCVNARDSIRDVGKLIIETKNMVIDEAYCSVHLGFACGEYVLISVSDNGCGIDNEMLPHIFEPFFTTKETGKGTGLGLATVYGIVKQNDGFIDVDTESGKGTTFTIYLPRYARESIEPVVKIIREPPKGHGETVLLVEDEPVILEVSREMLEHLGYSVLIAGAPGEAIRIAEANAAEIQLLIVDVVMPEMNGRDLAKRIGEIKPGLKCLFISGYTADVIAHHGILDPGINFIQKPFSTEKLAGKIREVLDSEKKVCDEA